MARLIERTPREISLISTSAVLTGIAMITESAMPSELNDWSWLFAVGTSMSMTTSGAPSVFSIVAVMVLYQSLGSASRLAQANLDQIRGAAQHRLCSTSHLR